MKNSSINTSLTSIENVDNSCGSRSTVTTCTSSGNKNETNIEKKTSKSFDKVVDYTKCQFYQALAPLFISLKLCGLYYVRSPDRIVSTLQIYCWVLAALPAGAIAVEIYVLSKTNKTDVNFFNLTQYICFGLLCLANSVECTKNSQNPKYLKKFVSNFERLDQYGGSFVSPTQVRKCTKIIVVIAWIFYVCNSIMLGYIEGLECKGVKSKKMSFEKTEKM